MNLVIREPEYGDENAFLEMTQASQHFHKPWINAPLSHAEFINYIDRHRQSNYKSYLLVDDEKKDIIGVFNLSEIVRGCFQNAYLGFYASAVYAGTGLMSAGLQLVLKTAFTQLGLHRLEANIQPDNIRSIQLVRASGFRKEGFSQKYLKINEDWRDHERWAITFEDWGKKEKDLKKG